ncbi:MAG: threonine synthase [Dehalococcoidia bacterium]|nr:threonine synthase [Dehalococcoidia bacterium]
MYSYLDHLECTICGETYPHAQPIRTCPSCGKVLFARYDLPKLKREVDRAQLETRSGSMWKFSELLPVLDPEKVLSLGEGDTPLFKASRLGGKLGLSNLYIKDEGLNPTGTFKARGLSAAVSKAHELGITKVTIPSAGNAAGAVAAYAARGGMEAHVFMPRDAPAANKIESEIMGSNLTLVDGLINDAGRLSRERAQSEGLFDLSTLQEPYRAEGKKTMGLEIALQLGWRMPDSIIYPTGGGTGIIGMWKGFYELLDLGWVEGKLPRFIAVQPEGCQPIVKAFNDGADVSELWPNASTIADGLRVPHPFSDYLILKAIRETGGTALSVSDDDMVRAMRDVASAEGLFICPEGAATLVALERLLEDHFLDPDENIVLLNTGSGYKYLDLLRN